MKGILLICLAALVPALAQRWWQPPEAFRPRSALTDGAGAAERVTLQTVRGWNRPVLWVDARTRAEFESGHVPAATLLNEDAWESLLPEFLGRWQPGQPVVVYCGASCESSRRVALRLRLAGIQDVHVLEGGWDAAQTLRP